MAVYAVADLHGQYNLFKMIKDFIYETNSFCYILGDCADRGENGFKILKEVLEDEEHFSLIKGNHEELFRGSMLGKANMRLHFYNGGKPTYEAWEREGKDTKYIEKINNLPFMRTYLNALNQEVVMTHSGYTPGTDQEEWDPLEQYLWNRDHFDDEWDEEKYPHAVMVHGHTPIPLLNRFSYTHLPSMDPGVFKYCYDSKGQFHKVNIDCGCFFTHRIAILNLDDWTQHIFYDEEVRDEY